MGAARVDLHVEAGSNFDFQLTWTDDDDNPVDLTGWSARSQARSIYRPSDEPAWSLSSVNEEDPDSGGISLGGGTGIVGLHLTAAQTDALPVGLIGLWDLELVAPGGAVTRVAEGAVTCSRQSTGNSSGGSADDPVVYP